jgi:hypothetical protein
MKIPWHCTVPKEIQDFKQAEGIYTTFNKLSKVQKYCDRLIGQLSSPHTILVNGCWYLPFNFWSLGSFSLRRRDLKYRSENSQF